MNVRVFVRYQYEFVHLYVYTNAYTRLARMHDCKKVAKRTKLIEENGFVIYKENP